MSIMQPSIDWTTLGQQLAEIEKKEKLTILGISVRVDDAVAPGEAHVVIVHQHRMTTAGTCADCGKHWDAMADGEWQQATIAATITGI